METIKRKGVSMGRTPRPQLDRSKAKRNIYYESSDSIGRNRDRQLTPSNSNVSRPDDEEWVEFSVHGKTDIQEMNMMLREIGLSPLQLGITTDDWNKGKRETESPYSVTQVSSASPDMSNRPSGEESHAGDSRTPSPVGEEYQPSKRSPPAESASPAVKAVGLNVVRGNNGHTENAQAPAPTARSSIISNHPREGGVDVSYSRSGSLPLGVGLPEDSPSRTASDRQVEDANSQRPIERTRSEPVSKSHFQGIQKSAAISPPASALNSYTNISSLQTDRFRKQELAGLSRGSTSIGSLTLKPPPRKNVLPIGPMLSTADMINSLGPDAVEGHQWIFSDSDGEEEKEEAEDSTEQSPASSSTVQNEPGKHLSNGAGIASREVNQSEEPNTEHANETDGDLTVRHVGEKLTVESANGPDVMDLTTVGDSPHMEHPSVSRTSSLYMEGPKFPWTKGSRLGAGSFGTVYNAVDSGGMFFAVKEVSIIEQDKQALQALAQLKQEVELLKRFKHDNIVQYLGTDQGGDKLYIFLELVELGSLAAVYKNFELVDSQISKYARDILRGLEYLHGRNILHRDIKCANILVDKTGTCKLADFGMAKQISSLDLTKSCMGSAYWMAPEVINPQKTYGPPADIWSLGCSVLEMATRAPPFGEMEWYRAMFTVGRGNAPPIPDTLSDSLRDFVKDCFEIEPKKRPTATELLHHPFITRGLGSQSSDPPPLPRSTTLQPITEERSSDFSSQQSSHQNASLDAEGRVN